MATASEIAAYRAAGHSVAVTAAQFNVSESRVYQAVRAVKAARRSAMSNTAPAARPAHVALVPTIVQLHNVAPLMRSSVIPSPDAIADGVQEWRDPVSGRCEVPAPGILARDWFAARKVLQSLPSAGAAPAPTSMPEISPAAHAPAHAPAHVQNEVGRGFSHVYAGTSIAAPVSVALHNSVAPVRTVEQSSVKRSAASRPSRAVEFNVWLNDTLHLWGPLLVGLLLCVIAFSGAW